MIAPMEIVSVVKRLVSEEQFRSGSPRAIARAAVATQAGLSPGTLENLERGRLKFMDRVAGKLNDFAVRSIERQISSLERELVFLRAEGVGRRLADIDAAEAAIAEARRHLGKS
jgi:hypothetical protein